MPNDITIAAGAIQNDASCSNAGHVRVFTWNGSAWIQKGLAINGEAANDNSGSSVSMPSEDIVAIGAFRNDGNGGNAGHVRVFRWSGTDWQQKGLDLDGEAANNLFGSSVSMADSNNLAVGANCNEEVGAFAGHARVFEWNGSAWIKKGVDIDAEAAQDQFGYSISYPSTNVVGVGSILNSVNGFGTGHVRLFSLCEDNTVDVIIACDSHTWID